MNWFRYPEMAYLLDYQKFAYLSTLLGYLFTTNIDSR